MPPDLLEGDLPGLQHPHQRRPRDAEHVGRLLSGQPSALRCDRHREPLLHGPRDTGQNIRHRRAQVDRLVADHQTRSRLPGGQRSHDLAEPPGNLLLGQVGLALDCHSHRILPSPAICDHANVLRVMIVLVELNIYVAPLLHKCCAAPPV